MSTPKRKDVKKEDRWNVEAIYPTLKAWEQDLNKLVKAKKAPFFPEIAQFKGKLSKNAKTVADMLKVLFAVEQKLRKLYCWAHLRHDEDITDETFKQALDRIMTISQQFGEEAAWITPELQKIPKAFLKTAALKEYAFYLEKVLRLAPHTLNEAEEKLLALSSTATDAASKAFRAMSDADFKFGTVLDSKGAAHPLTHASFSLYMRSRDRTLRKNAFQQMNGKYAEFENCITELLSGEIQGQLFHAKARHYDTCLDAALFPKDIDPSVYRALIQAVHKKIGVLHKYMKLRKKALKLKELHLYDVYVPFVEAVDMKFSYTEAEDLVIDSVAPLGKEYQETLRNGLKKERWSDRYENQNKRSGAYSSGCYDTSPYILMNFKGTLRDVFTLAHEAGHSMHSYFSRSTQPFHYADYPIFVAEVASTFNEELLMHHLLQKSKNKQEQAFLINEKLEDIRATLFRQTMFAEFELFLHESAEQRKPLTPAILKAKYLELNRFYFGKDTVIDPEIATEWARIPHFYYGYYVYQYATGISAAVALAQHVLKGSAKDKAAYLKFLQSGSSDFPIDLLKKAGVDMRSTKPVEEAIAKFSMLTDQLEKLLK